MNELKDFGDTFWLPAVLAATVLLGLLCSFLYVRPKVYSPRNKKEPEIY